MTQKTLEPLSSIRKVKKARSERAWDIVLTNLLCSIRTKSYITLLVAFLIFYAAILGIVLGFFPNTFFTFETSEMNTKSRRINKVIDDVARDLAQFTTQNIAAFDGMFDAQNAFNADGDFTTFAAYIDQFWGESAFTKWDLDFCAYYFMNGTKILHRVWDHDARAFINTLPSVLSKFPFSAYDPSDTFRRDMAIILDNKSAYLIAATPIQTTNFGGPIPGIIISAKKFAPTLINELTLRAQLCLTVYSFNNKDRWFGINSTSIPSSFYNTPIRPNISSIAWQDLDMQSISVLYKNQPSLTSILSGRNCFPSNLEDPISNQEKTLSTDRLQGFNLYSDITGQNGLIIRVDVPRTSNDLANYTMMVVLVILAAVGIIFFILLAILLEYLVLFKMTRLSYQVKRIRKAIEKDKDQSNLGVTVPWANDEVQYLSLEMNHLLKQIQQYNAKMEMYVNQLGSEEGAVRMMVNSLPDSVVIVDPASGKVINANTTFEKVFFTVANLKDKTIYDILPEMKDNLLFKSGRLPNTQVTAHGVFGTKLPSIICCVALPNVYENDVEVLRNMIVIHDAREKEESDARLKQQLRAQEAMKKQIQFEEQFSDPIIREAFIKFCKKEQTVENVHVLIELDNYKKLDQAARLKKQKLIFDRYLKEGASEGVNISNESKIEAVGKCQNGVGQIDLFYNLEKAIKFNLMNESFSRFQAVKIELIDEVLKEMEEKQKKIHPNLRVTGSVSVNQMKNMPIGFLQGLEDAKRDRNSSVHTGSSGSTPTPVIRTPEPLSDNEKH